jgi:excisionase family DNA binding protein
MTPIDLVESLVPGAISEAPHHFVGRFRALTVSVHIVRQNPSKSPTADSTVLVDGPLLCPDDAAQLLAVKPSWVYEAVRARRMPYLRVGRHIRFTRPMLERWLAENAER